MRVGLKEVVISNFGHFFNGHLSSSTIVIMITLMVVIMKWRKLWFQVKQKHHVNCSQLLGLFIIFARQRQIQNRENYLNLKIPYISSSLSSKSMFSTLIK